MQIILILLIVASAGLVVVSLVRGLIHFTRTSDALANGGDGDGPSAMHLAQNRMMFARVKWQAITIALLVIVGMVAGSR